MTKSKRVDRPGGHDNVIPGSPEAILNLIARVSFAVVERAPMFVRMYEATRHICDSFGVDGCVMRELVGDSLHLTACNGMPQDALLVTLPAGSDVASEILSTRRPMTVFDMANNPMLGPLHSAATGKSFEFHTYAGAPMLLQGKALGIIGIYSLNPARRFSESDLYYLQVVANHLAVAIDNQRLYCQVKSQRDGLERKVEERRQVEIELTSQLELSEARRRRERKSGTGSGTGSKARNISPE